MLNVLKTLNAMLIALVEDDFNYVKDKVLSQTLPI